MKTLFELSSNRQNSIGLLRTLAALMVIYGHSFPVAPTAGQTDWFIDKVGVYSGGMAVDFFFLLSGFLVCGSINSRGVLNYIVARSLRLFPALIVMLLVTVFIAGPLFSTLTARQYFSDPQTWKYFFSLATLRSTEWFLPGLFVGNPDHAVNGSIWSVLVEARVYVLLALAYVVGLVRKERVLLFNFLFVGVSFLAWTNTIDIPLLKGDTDRHVAFMFFVGVFLWMNRQSITVSPLLALLILLVAAYPSGPKGVVLAYILVLILIFCTVAFLPTFSFFEKIGDFSYGIYLWGWPIQQMLKHRYADMSSHSNAIAASIICVIIGAISWYFLEKPALTLKDRILGWKVFSYFKR